MTPLPTGLELADRLGVRSPSAVTRSLAFVIDASIWAGLVTLAVVGAIMLASGSAIGWAIALICVGVAGSSVFGLIQLILHGRKGVTAGKAAMKLRSVSIDNLAQPGFWRIVLRVLVLWASGIVPLVGPLIMLGSGIVHPRGRNLLDRVGRVWLVDTRAGIDPADEKTMRRTKRAIFTPKREVSERLESLATGAGLQSTPLEQRSAAAIVGVSRGAWRETSKNIEQPSEAPLGAGRYVLVFDDAQAMLVHGEGLIGRQPEAPGGRADVAKIALSDPARQLSKTHLAFGTDEHGLWIKDLGSSNGTFLVGDRGAEREITQGVRVHLETGQVVRVGGRAFQLRHEGDNA